MVDTKTLKAVGAANTGTRPRSFKFMSLFTAKFYKMLLLASVPALIAWLILDTLRAAGEFKTLTPRFNGSCKSISGVVGSEDITIDPRTGMAFISSADFRALLQGKQKQGAVYAYDLKSPTAELINLTANFTQEFHPHGISLFISENHDPSLFVINHRQGGHYVEIFDYRNGALLHRESISGELMTSPNDLVAVGPRSFYVTNDHGNVSTLGRTLEEYLRLARAYVLYYDGKRFEKAAQGIAMANGINVSHDGKTLYVAATTGLKIHVYAREVSSGALEMKNEIFLDTGVDNIERDTAGNLWVGAHPQLLTFVGHAKDPAKLSPSQVLKITPGQDSRYQLDEIYLNKGEALSGASVGAVFDQKLIIGSVFDDHFLVCEIR